MFNCNLILPNAAFAHESDYKRKGGMEWVNVSHNKKRINTVLYIQWELQFRVDGYK